MNALIIDDEEKARTTLRLMLQMFCSEMKEVREVTSVDEAVQCLSGYDPDIVFLDINMPRGNGFQLLERIDPPTFRLIFVTAFDQYAIKAIRVNAIDYLLKPVDPDRLVEAVTKAANSLEGQPSKVLRPTNKLGVPVNQGIRFLEIDLIIRIESDGNYSRIWLDNEGPLLVSRTLKELACALVEEPFCRVHNSHLVNLHYVQEYQRAYRGMLVMKGGVEIPISRSQKENVLRTLDRQFNIL